MAYQYSTCDSYFVMSEMEHHEKMRREHAKAYEEQVKAQRQLHMALELSRAAKEEYGEDHLIHLEEQESKTLPDVASIDIQTEIQWYMRPFLLDFLIEAHASFGLLPETLFLTINLLDRYCSKRVVYRKHYQLVGCTALLIASKYGEPGKKVPRIRELANMCCHLYEEDMFTQMERHVMVTLDWVIGPPTVDCFLRIALDDEEYIPEVEHMARYIAEMALFHKEFVSTRPSELARASLALTRVIFNLPQPHKDDWASSYDSITLVSLSQSIHHPSQVLSQKYSTPHLSRAALLLEDFLAAHAAAASSQVSPPTPPAEQPKMSEKGASGNPTFETPQKHNPYPPNMPHGCLTPPITPEDGCFGKVYQPTNNLDTMARDCPGTPTPLKSQPVHMYPVSYYQPAAIM